MHLPTKSPSNISGLIWRFAILFVLALFAAVIGWALRENGLNRFSDWIRCIGVYLLCFLPLIYLVDADVFSAQHWHFPRGVGKAVLAGTGLQLVVQLVGRLVEPPISESVPKYAVLASLTFFPVVEEIIRAAMLQLLMTRLTMWTAVLISSVLFALLHALPWHAFVGGLLLGTVFLRTPQSIPATIATHLTMNLIPVWFYRHLIA